MAWRSLILELTLPLVTPMKIWRSIAHPLKPLLYIEWLLLTLAVIYPWLPPQETLQLLLHRDGQRGSVSVGLGTSHPLGILIPIVWLIACVLCWRIPSSNKRFISFILGFPIVLIIATGLADITPFPIVINWILFSIGVAGFTWLGTQILEQKTLLNQWLYNGVAFLLIWWIFIMISAIQINRGPHLETLLLLHLVALIRASLMFIGVSRWLAIAGFFFSYHSVSIVIGMIWSNLMDIIAQPVTIEASNIRKLVGNYVFNVTIVFTLITALLILLVNSLISERRNREHLAQAHSQLRQYAQRIEDQTLLEERNRIAREIHDSLGHTLTAQSIQLENALVYFNPDTDNRAYSFITQAKMLSHTALQDIRRSVSQMRNNLLLDQSFDQAIATLLQEFRLLTAADLTYHPLPNAIRIPLEIQTAFYRIIQESLTNIIRHSHADTVTIDMTTQSLAQPPGTGIADPLMAESGTTDLLLRLRIMDNGYGFQGDQTTSGFGLQGIRERTTAIGGQLHIQSAPQQGCTVQVEVLIHSWLTPSASLSSMTKP
jgi:signal transduction histidine kinase